MQLEQALTALEQHSDVATIEQKTAYHKQERPVLGVPNSVLNELTKEWRQSLTLDERLSLAAELWQTNIFEARICAAKLLTQARIKDDQAVWDLLRSWLPDFDSWAIADHVASALQKRLVADPSRLETVADWTQSEHIWTRRAVLVATLPWAKMPNPKPADLEIRDQVLGWAADYIADRNWFIQKSVAWWVRDLSKHDAERSRAFLDTHGPDLKAFARKEAGKYLKAPSDG